MREYKARTRQDPAVRARDNRINRESAARTREWKRYQLWGKFPYGYEVPVGYEGHEVFVDFQAFIESVILPGDPMLSAVYWQNRFDPRCDDAHERWAKIVAISKERSGGGDPLQKFKERANRLIRNKERLPSPTHSQ